MLKAPEDLQALVTNRINEHKAAEQKKQDELREQIRREEAERLEREANERAAEEKRIADAAEAQRQADEAEAQRKAQDAIAAAATPAPAVMVTAIPEAGVQITTAAPVAARVSPALPTESGARLTLGQINERLAPISITVAGLSELGFDPVEQVKSSRMYRESDLGSICEALIQHLTTVADGVMA